MESARTFAAAPMASASAAGPSHFKIVFMMVVSFLNRVILR